MRLIILAAGRGVRLRPLTDARPKCLVEVLGRAILDWQLEAARQAGIRDVVAVGGYRAEQLGRPGLRVVVNPVHDTTNMVTSLFCAEEFFGDAFILSYGDIVYGPAVLEALLADQAPIGVIVDREWREYWEMRFTDPLADAESLRLGRGGQIVSIGQREVDIARIEGQYIGVVSFRAQGVEALRQGYGAALAADRAGQFPFGGTRPLAKLFMTDLLQGMIDLGHPVTAVPIRAGWLEIDSRRDLELAEELLATGRRAIPLPTLGRSPR